MQDRMSKEDRRAVWEMLKTIGIMFGIGFVFAIIMTWLGGGF